jgi:hypothetical protein
MHLYRFRLLFEEQEDFLRDYDILAAQTFLEFHKLIVETVELKGNELASFFICDRNWRKKKEITLIDMNQGEEDTIQYEEDDDERTANKSGRIPILEMANVKLKDAIDDPHQRLLFEYDFLNPKTFFIELVKIINVDSKEGYPKCIKSVGKLTPVPVNNLPFMPEDADEITLPGEFDEITENDDEDDISFDTSSDVDKEW